MATRKRIRPRVNEDTDPGQDYYISTDPKKIDYHFVTNGILGSYWGGWRTHENIADSIKNSLCFGVYFHAENPLYTDKQVGFARVVTDRATFSWIADVFIDQRHQKKGLAKFLMHTIVNHHDLCRTVMYLKTRDAHSLYEKFGFEKIDAMRRVPRPD